jgi:hypothetical protein
MSINQSIKFANSSDFNNPNGLYEFVKPPRWVFNTTDPIDTTGENEWFFTNITTGDHFIKTLGTWTFVYNFSTGAPSPGLTTLANDGVGVQWFKSVIGTTAHLRTMASSTGKITFATLPNEIDLTVNINKNDVQLSNVQNILNNYTAVVDPNGGNDSSQGYSIGSIWINSAGIVRLFIARSVGVGTAQWDLSANSNAITTIVNDGAGFGEIFINKIGTTAHLRRIASSSTNILSVNDTEISLNVANLTPSSVGLSLLENTKYVHRSNVNPTVNDDSSQNYAVGNLWANYALGTLYLATSVSVGSAVWVLIAPFASARNDNDYTARTGASTNVQTSFSGVGVPQFLNVGAIAYQLVNQKGTWSSSNAGFGIVQNYGPPSNSISGNRYMITYTLACHVSVASASSRRYELRVNTGNGGLPGSGIIAGSRVNLFFPPTGEATTNLTVTKSCVFDFGSSGTVQFFFSIEPLTNTDSIFEDSISFSINQIA